MRAALRGTHKDPSGYFISNSDFGVHFTIDGIRQSIPLVAVNIEVGILLKFTKRMQDWSSGNGRTTSAFFVQVRMVDMIAEVVLEQIFANPYNLTVVDCEYAFPMDNRAVLKDLIVTIGDRKIVGQVEERTKVFLFFFFFLGRRSLPTSMHGCDPFGTSSRYIMFPTPSFYWLMPKVLLFQQPSLPSWISLSY